ADVDARVALDAQAIGEHGLHVAVQAALRFLPRGGDVEAELDLGLDVLQRLLDVAPRHLVARIAVDLVVVAPLVDAHLLRHHGDAGRGTLADVFARQDFLDGDRGVMPMRDRPDDVLRPERGVAAEEDVRHGRLHRGLVDHRQAPFVELDAGVALDPREGVLLADRDEHVVALVELVGLAGRDEVAAAFVVVDGLDLLEGHAAEAAIGQLESFGHQVVEDRDAFVHRVLFLPRARLHLVEARPHSDFYIIPSKAPRGAAAVHRGVAAAEHDDALADPAGVAERHRREPVDADVDVLRGLLAAGDVEVAAARRAAADEDGVVALRQQRLHAVDLALLEVHAEVEDVADLLVDHLERQAEARDLRPDHAARARVLVEHGDVVTERGQVARDGERRRASADADDFLAVLL